MWPGMIQGDVAVIKDGLQAVAAAMGGLIGSIIGYYFGESKATRAKEATPTPPVPSAPVQAPQPPTGGAPGVTPVAKPPVSPGPPTP